MKVGDPDIEKIVFERTKGLLLKCGVKGWNMNLLAQECNMSKRTLYKIIGNKEDLLYKLTYNTISSDIIRINKFLQSDKPFFELLHNLSDVIINGFEDYNIQNIEDLLVEYPKIREMQKEQVKKHREVFISFFQKGKDEGFIADYAEPETLERMMNAFIVYHLHSCNNKAEFKKHMEKVINTFIKGITK
jgi:AcrR family transcriptional regulator